MKRFFLIFGVVLVTLLNTVMTLSTTTHQMPSGNRALILLEYAALTTAALAALSALVLISRQHRNLTAFLKTYVMFGALLVVGSCSGWNTKFNGPPREFASTNGVVSATTPSNWTRDDKMNPNADLVVTDWAGTKALMATDGGEWPWAVADTPTLDAGLDELQSGLVAVFGKPLRRIDCGTSCRADVFAMTTDGKAMNVVSGVKRDRNRLLTIQGTSVAVANDRYLKEVIAMFDGVRSTAKPATP